MTRYTTQVSAEAPSAALSTPSLASWSATPLNASVAIRIDTVNPMPAIAPPPTTEAHPTGGRTRPALNRVTSHVDPAIPSGLPTT